MIFSQSNYTTTKGVVCLVYFYTWMRFDSCCVLDHQLLEFYMLKFIDLQKAFSYVLSARLCLLLFVHRECVNLAGRELTVLSLIV